MAPKADALLHRFREYVTATGEGDETNASASLAEGRALVEQWIGTRNIPAPIRDRAVIEVAAELFYHKAARNGVSEWGGTDLAPFRIARDPMKAAYPILLQSIPGGLA